MHSEKDGRLGLTAERSRALPGGYRTARPVRRKMGTPSMCILAAIGLGMPGWVPDAAASVAGTAAEAPTVGTWFDGLGSPYGGCGVPQDLLETQSFVALNVYDTPGEYANFPVRPLTGADLAAMGAFENGRNCGRWIRVTLGPFCTGTNDGAPGQPFCRGAGAQWVDDAFSGGALDMIVADSCGDGNAWCRDSRLHLDLSKSSLARFEKDGALLDNLEPGHWNNRGLSWEYEPAPDYSGDIRLFFLKGTQKYWPAILVTHLPNGIHAVEQRVNGAWKTAERFSDMGQAFVLSPAETFRIRLIDADDKPVLGGREYEFPPPASCGGTCDAAATPTEYQAFSPDGTALLPRAGSRSGPPDFRLHVAAFPTGIRVEFTPSEAGATRVPGATPASGTMPASGTWSVSAVDPRGRVAAIAAALPRADGSFRADLNRPSRGVYVLVLRSGAIVSRVGSLAVP